MKIFDMHIHVFPREEAPDPAGLLSRMERAGVYGGCLISTNPPFCQLGPSKGKLSIAQRIDEILAWTKGYEGRLFPILWIHPDEEDAEAGVDLAVERGIAGFKIICNDFYVYEEKCMRLLRRIAAANKPVLFHTGILWDGTASSNYNRPLNWEAMLDIPGLRFSMGHCSWPWIDECIALYGKLLNAYAKGKSAEMFFDLTPGTPELYREELLRKLFYVGYDIPNNILYGTDGTAHNYSNDWTARWLKIDSALMDSLGVSEKTRGRLFESNLMRFLGIGEQKVKRFIPTADDQTVWSPQMDV